MPSKVFFNLPAEKRERIIAAAYHEFSQNIFEKASIRNILAEADIGTGSFYRYFESKDELYLYVIDQKFRETNKLVMEGDDNAALMMQNPIWDMFRQSSSDIRKKYYFRMQDHYLYEMRLKQVAELGFEDLKDPRKETAVAFLLAVLPFVTQELSLLTGEDYKDDWQYLQSLILKGLSK